MLANKIPVFAASSHGEGQVFYLKYAKVFYIIVEVGALLLILLGVSAVFVTDDNRKRTSRRDL